MLSVRPLPEFTGWLESLKDQAVQGIIVARITRLELGLMGDVAPVGDGVSELKIHIGAGWRLYSPGEMARSLCCWRAVRSERRARTFNAPRYWQLCWIERKHL
jgi:putative addiction module killer protein